ncbi:MAG: RHS repeat-associated core domain-containing protein, partial [Candidatus Korobacteraceae bacterium]
ENYAGVGTVDRSFTGQNEDSVSNILDFPFRQYTSTQGRWMVPDPAGLAAVDITNPQTWNRYAYVANNPLNATDPLGLYDAVLGCMGGDLACSIDGGGGAGFITDTNSGNSDPSSGSSGGVDCGWVCQFFSGQFSGTWTQNQQNNWVSQQWWQQQKSSPNDPMSKVNVNSLPNLWSFLPQNQNPNAQANISETQWEKSGNTGLGTQGGSAFPALLPQQNPFPPPARASALTSCLIQYDKNVEECTQSYPSGSPELLSCVTRAQRTANICSPAIKPFP